MLEDDYLTLNLGYFASGSCVLVDFVDVEQLFCCVGCQPLLTGDLMTEHYHGTAGTLMVS